MKFLWAFEFEFVWVCFIANSPVTRITFIQMLMAFAALHNLKIHQMDVKNTLLSGALN